MRVISFEDIKLNNIKLKKPISLNKSYKISIKHKNIELVLQTPIMQLVFGITQFGFNRYIDVSLFENNPEILIMKQTIQKLNNYIKKRILSLQSLQSCNSLDQNELVFSENIKPKVENYNERLRLYLNSDMICFNEQREKINTSFIKLKDNVKLLICPSHIWINKNKYGISWEVLQMKLYKIIVPQKYLFIDEKEKLYTKYFDLINKGVPRDAVKQKIIMDGLDPNFIDRVVGINMSSGSDIPPPPPPPPPLLGPMKHKSNNSSNKMALLNDIKNGNFKLNKNKIQSKKNIETNDNNSFKPPSLEEILNKRKSLKKI
jgi:hypothetical protein